MTIDKNLNQPVFSDPGAVSGFSKVLEMLETKSTGYTAGSVTAFDSDAGVRNLKTKLWFSIY